MDRGDTEEDKGVGCKERFDEHHVLFLSQTTSPMRCFCAVTCLCLSDLFAKTKACYVQKVVEMCG